MKLVAFDTETHLVQPGLLAPPLVCGSTADDVGAMILDAEETRDKFVALLESEAIIVGANLAYDMVVMANDAYEQPEPAGDAVIRMIFEKYDRDEIFDVQIAEQLHAIAGGHLGIDPRTGGGLRDPQTGKLGRYSLSIVSDLVLGRVDAKKNDFWRLRYAILEKVPREHWPADAIQYPRDDAKNTLDVAVGQLKHRNLHDVPAQARAAFAFALASTWGFRTDEAAVDKLESEALAERAAGRSTWLEAGLIDEDGSKEGRVVKGRLAQAYGARDPCPACKGTGKVPNKTGKAMIYCTDKANAGRTTTVTRWAQHDWSSYKRITPGIEVATCSKCHARTRPGEREGTCIREEVDVCPRGCDGTGLDLADAPMLARTPTGNIKAGRDELHESGDESLMGFAEYCEDDKLFNVYIPFLREGTKRPLNPRANVLVASGRTSYDGVIQLIPREGGVRDCFVPRPGFVYASTDFSSGELCTLAQVTLWTVGRSKMAEVINATKDPGMLHTEYGAKLVGVTPAELTARIKAGDATAKGFRQAAKALNFGLPGGMGAAKLVLAKRKKSEGKTTAPDGKVYNGIRFCVLVGGAVRCGVEMITEWKRRPTSPVCKRCVQLAEDLKREWLAFFDEMPAYFEYISNNVDLNGELTQLVSDRVRGGLSFCDGANTLFQGLLADGAKRALWMISREMYTDRNSALYGSRVNAFFHDEVFSEMPEDIAPVAGVRQAELMVEGLKEYCPDVYVECQPALMRRWSKSAEPVFVDGKLTVWEPKR